MADQPTIDKDVNFEGLKCPLPVLKARKAIKEVPVGGRLRIRVTDPMAELDLKHFCHESGHEMESTDTEGDVHIFILRRGA